MVQEKVERPYWHNRRRSGTFTERKKRIASYIVNGMVILIFLLLLRTLCSTAHVVDVEEKDLAIHPIDTLIANARTRWQQKQAGQSRLYEDAVKNYIRRYSMDPPPGFDAWFKYAKANAVSVIDDYDAIMDDLEPFRSLTASEINHRAKLLIHTGAQEVNTINIVQVVGGNISVLFEPARDPIWQRRAEMLASMLRAVKFDFPTDMWFPVNEDAPPRVIVSHERMQQCADGDCHVESAEFTKHSNGTLFELIKQACPPDSPINLPHQSRNVSSMEFVAELADEQSICDRPDVRLYHSAFRQQMWSTLGQLFPLFSYGTTTVHRDIRIPAMMFYSSDNELPVQTKYGFNPEKDVMWSEKQESLFWRGRTTDGVVDDYEFEAQQRHRLVNLGHESRGHIMITGVDESSKKVRSVQESKLNLNEELMNTWFTRAMTGNRTCSMKNDQKCEDLKRDHPFLNKWTDHDEAWGYKYLADVDGYGYSAKFRSLLESTSLPIKATLYKEYFNNYLVPWVHYVPLSHSMSELYNILVYFTGRSVRDEEGRAIELIGHDAEAQEIAENGSQWVKRYMRREDMIAYTFRLALEWGRLSNESADRGRFR